MAKIYISSTYNDLKEYREAVYRTLRKMRHDVIAMEDYVATDQRPLDRCLNDVAACDLYLGIFAWGYRCIPQKDNPEGRSITELEYRKAEGTGITRLVFLLSEQTPWLPAFSDSHTGQGEHGKQIATLREELGEDKMVGFFRSSDELASLVSSAVANWEREQLPQPPSPAARPTDSDTAAGLPQPREVTRHATILYESIDQDFVFQLSDRLRPFGRSFLLSPRALFANEPEDFQDLDRVVCQCHTAVVVLSDILLAHLDARPEQTELILDILRARTGSVFALCRTANAMQDAKDWGILQAIDASGWAHHTAAEIDVVSRLDLAISACCPERPGRAVGLPFVVIAMRQEEALELALQGETLITQRLKAETAEQFQVLRNALNLDLVSAAKRYGATREAWQPFIGNDRPVGAVIANVVRELNDAKSPQLRGRLIKAQHYSFDALVRQEKSLRQLYRELAQSGCVVVIDELSMFHPTVRDALIQSPLFNSERAAFVTISPFDADHLSPNQVLETQLRERLAVAFDRFMQDYDPQCEFGIGNEHRLKRWLHSSLPETLQTLRTPPPSRRALEDFAREVGQQPQHSFPGLLEGGAP